MELDGVGRQSPVREAQDRVVAVAGEADLHSGRLRRQRHQLLLPAPGECDTARRVELDEISRHDPDAPGLLVTFAGFLAVDPERAAQILDPLLRWLEGDP